MSDYKVTTKEAPSKAQEAPESDDRMPSPAKQREIIELALKRFRRCSDDWSEQRRAEVDDLKFQVPEMQWSDEARRAREGNPGSGNPTPPRPCLSISLIDQPLQLVKNQMLSAHLGVNVHPLGPDSEDETAEVQQGMYRQIERESNADEARAWAFDRASKCGTGVWRVTSEYDDAGGHPFDQVIRINRVLYQDSVYFDMAATKADFSDGKYAFVCDWMRREDFEETYPDHEAEVSLAFQASTQSTPKWVNNEENTVLVAEYYYKEFEEVTLVALKNGMAVEEDELTDEDEVNPDIPKRKKKVPVLRWCKLTGASERLLDYEECDGKYIPLIPMLGEELSPFDGKRRFQGIIRPAKDAQRVHNYGITTAAEIAALEPKSPVVMAEGQDEGFEQEWQQINNRNIPVAHYKPTDVRGQPVPPPQRMQIDSGRLSVSLQLAEMARNGVQSTTQQAFDPNLGNLPSKGMSGKAILARQSQADAGTSHFLHNLASAMRYEATVILDLLPSKYDRKGRLVRVLDEEDESDTVMLNHEHYTDPSTGKPQPIRSEQFPDAPQAPPAPPGPMNGQMMGGNGQPMPMGPPEVKKIDLRAGAAYGSSVTIGKSWQTKLEQGAEEIGQILQSLPNYSLALLPLYLQFRDFPGHQAMADILKKVRAHEMPFLDQPDNGQPPSPEVLQAQLSAAQQHIQMLTQQLQGAGQVIQTKQVEHQAKTQQVQIKSQSDMEIAQLKAQVALILAKINADSKARDIGLQHGHEADQAQQANAHELGMQAHAQAAAAAAAAAKPLIAPYTASDTMPLGSEEGI